MLTSRITAKMKWAPRTSDSRNRNSIRRSWCRGPESNRYAPLGTQDFKSWDSVFRNSQNHSLIHKISHLFQFMEFAILGTFSVFLVPLTAVSQPKVKKFIQGGNL